MKNRITSQLGTELPPQIPGRTRSSTVLGYWDLGFDLDGDRTTHFELIYYDYEAREWYSYIDDDLERPPHSWISWETLEFIAERKDPFMSQLLDLQQDCSKLFDPGSVRASDLTESIAADSLAYNLAGSYRANINVWSALFEKIDREANA